MPRPAKSGTEDKDPTVACSVRSVATSSAKNSACLANHVGKILFEDVKTLSLKNKPDYRCPHISSYLFHAHVAWTC